MLGNPCVRYLISDAKAIVRVDRNSGHVVLMFLIGVEPGGGWSAQSA